MLELVDNETEHDIDPYQQRVESAAQLVADGVVALAECEAHEANGRTDEVYRADVRERAEALAGDTVVDEPEDADTDTTQKRTAVEIDWPALWAEFEMDTPDAHGSHVKSRTKVREALRVSEQNIVGDVRQILDDAAEAGTLHERQVNTDDGAVISAGYILTEGSA